jgi:hypothetical protein
MTGFELQNRCSTAELTRRESRAISLAIVPQAAGAVMTDGYDQ